MARKGPRTSKGQFNKWMTSDGRKKFSTAIGESLFGKKEGEKGNKNK